MPKQHILRSRLFRGHAFTDVLLLDAFERIAEIMPDHGAFDAENFAFDIKQILRMGHHPNV